MIAYTGREGENSTKRFMQRGAEARREVGEAAPQQQEAKGLI